MHGLSPQYQTIEDSGHSQRLGPFARPVLKKVRDVRWKLDAFLLSEGVRRKMTEAQQYTVTKVVVIAKPSTYTGPCPATIEFLGTIFVSRPARVEYRWERSDGVLGPRESVDSRSAGKGVTTTWKMGTPRRSFSGWERLHVLAPASMISNQATVQIKCN